MEDFVEQCKTPVKRRLYRDWWQAFQAKYKLARCENKFPYDLNNTRKKPEPEEDEEDEDPSKKVDDSPPEADQNDRDWSRMALNEEEKLEFMSTFLTCIENMRNARRQALDHLEKMLECEDWKHAMKKVEQKDTLMLICTAQRFHFRRRMRSRISISIDFHFFFRKTGVVYDMRKQSMENSKKTTIYHR